MLRLLITLTLVLRPFPALAVDCSRLADPDQRRYCRAVVYGNVAECAAIRDRTLKITCEADLTGDARRCAAILDVQARTVCQAATVREE